MSKIQEIFLPLIGCEKVYEISNTGKIKILKTGAIIKQRINKFGYSVCSIYYAGSGYRIKPVHLLVATNFMNKPICDKFVNHIDGNKLNNHIDNLDLKSVHENITQGRPRATDFVPIKNYEGLYEINKHGVVRSLDRIVDGTHGPCKLMGGVIKGRVGKLGYEYVIISKNAITKTLKIHRLIAQHFIPNEKKETTVNHINGIKSDNRIENLEWVSGVENTKHAYSTGLTNNTGSNNGRSKLTEKDVLEIYKSRDLQIELAKKYGIAQTSISAIKIGKSWNHITNHIR